jgi:hypothetical protein
MFYFKDKLETRVEIDQAPLSQFSLIAEFFFRKMSVKDRDGRISTLLNLNLIYQPFTQKITTSKILYTSKMCCGLVKLEYHD